MSINPYISYSGIPLFIQLLGASNSLRGTNTRLMNASGNLMNELIIREYCEEFQGVKK